MKQSILERDLHGENAGKVNDAKVMNKIPVEAGSFYLMDKGYVAFEKLHKYFHQRGAYFVTRAKDNMAYEVIESRPVAKGSGVLSDETIRLTGYYSTRKYPDTLRLVVYEDFESGKVYHFLTNNVSIKDPLTIVELYRERWQIELFFKWIKQHLHIKTFYGTTQNAVYTQIWIAVCDYLLLIIAKKRYGLVPSLHSISNSIGQVLFKRADIRELYNQPTAPVSVLEKGAGEQLTLW
ncbi:MAG: IS4 family transposase [Bacteroidaceae bacterium]|nr:IS4 family transposase [Bacteroidaceae bacterium]